MFSEGEKLLLQRLREAVPGLSEDALGIIWTALKTEVARRLSIERKPVDLGFAKLIPVPYRQDWKERLIAKREAFHDAIDDPKLMAIHPKFEFILWSIECLPASDVLRIMDEHECARREKLGLVDYSDQIIHKDAPAATAVAVKVINRHINRCSFSSPVRRRKGDFRILSHRDTADENCRMSPATTPTQDQPSAPDPSTACPEDKSTQSPEPSTRIQPSESPPDSPREEHPVGIAEAAG